MSLPKVRVASLADLPPGAALPVKVNGHAVALFNDGGEIRAVDNRCPHMGYPLVEAPVTNGVLRCPWHHWRFDLATGGCLTAGGDDVSTFAVELRGDQIWLGVEPHGANLDERRERAQRDLEQGMVEVNTFLLAKALCALRACGIEDQSIIRQAVEYGLKHRVEGFGPGLVILTSLLNLYDRLPEEDQLLALVHGVGQMAGDSANRAPRRPLRPLPDRGRLSQETLVRLFRQMIEDREAAGAERVLRTCCAQGGSLADAAELLLVAGTDHFFLSTGHVLDFTNKAFELIDHLGDEAAESVLASLTRPMAGAFRHDESADWEDAGGPLAEAFARFDTRPADDPAWADDGTLLELLLEGDPPEIIRAMSDAVQRGAGPRALAAVVCDASMLRVARFHLQNENDWDDVLHLVSYNHAVDRLAARFAGRPATDFALLRAVFHGAVYCHLTRFLNVPAVPLPHQRRHDYLIPDEPRQMCERLLHCAEFQQVEEAAAIADRYLRAGHDSRSIEAALIKALLREDSVFHTFQMVEAGIARHVLKGGGANPELVAAARYLTAQKLRRGVLWSTRNALTLARGEGLNTRPATHQAAGD